MSALVSKITLFLHKLHHSKIQKYEHGKLHTLCLGCFKLDFGKFVLARVTKPLHILKNLIEILKKWEFCFEHFLDSKNAKSYS